MNPNFDSPCDELLALHLRKRGKSDFDFKKWEAKFPEEAAQMRRIGASRESNRTITWSSIWRTVMKNPYTKFGTVVVSLIVVAIFLFPSKNIAPTSVAWGDVQKKLEEKTAAFISGTRVCTYDTGKVETLRVHKYVSKEYGYVEKMFLGDQSCFDVYVHRPSQTVTVISHYRKQFFRFQVPEDLIKMFDIVSFQGAIDFLCSDEVEKVGPKEVQGREVIGFIRTDVDQYLTHMIDSKLVNFLVPIQSSQICVWIDPETLLPVFGENELEVGKGWVTAFHGMHMSEFLDHIDWEAELKENVFLPQIPADYQLFGMPEIKTGAVIGASGSAAIVPVFIWLRRRKRHAMIDVSGKNV